LLSGTSVALLSFGLVFQEPGVFLMLVIWGSWEAPTPGLADPDVESRPHPVGHLAGSIIGGLGVGAFGIAFDFCPAEGLVLDALMVLGVPRW